MTQQVSVARTVLYTLSKTDADAINKRRLDFAKYRAMNDHYEDTGYVAHTGNTAYAGDQLPAVVVAVHGEGSSVNLHVLLDGVDTYWATSVSEGEGPRTWSWPPRV